MSAGATADCEKKTAAPVRRDGLTSTTWKGSKMQEQLNTADLEIEIGDLIEFHKPSGDPFFGVWTTCHFTSGRVGATVHVDERFAGDHVTVTETEEKVHHTIDASGLDLREALNVLRDRLLASAPSYEIQRGA